MRDGTSSSVEDPGWPTDGRSPRLALFRRTARKFTHGWVQTLSMQLLLVLVLLLAWWWFSRDGRVPTIMLPPLEDAISAAPDVITSPVTRRALWITGYSVAGGFLLSAGFGLLVGGAAGRTPYGTRFVEPLLVWGQTVPIVLFYPVCVLLFGLGPGSKIVFAGLYGFFPIALNTARGLANTPRHYEAAAASMGVSRQQLLWAVKLPAARPMIVSGLRLGAAMNLVAVLAGEILASTGGLGYQIAASANTFRTANLYVYIVLALILVLIFNAAITRAEGVNAQ